MVSFRLTGAIVLTGVVCLIATQAARSDEQPTQRANAAYVLHREDTLTVRVPEADEFTVERTPYRIDNDGFLNLPLVGRLRAAGLTTPELERDITERLKQYYLNPRVSVSPAELHTEPVSVLGSVNTPGLQRVAGGESIIEGLSRAGGLKADAGPTLTLTRRLEYGRIPLPGAKDDPTGQFSVVELKIAPIVSGKDAADNISLRPHDVITVPRAEMIYVLGDVMKTGGYILDDKEQMFALKALALAGGLTRMASPGSARLLRFEPGKTTRTDIPVDLAKIMKNRAPDMELRPGDILFVPTNLTKRIATRTIETAITVGSSLAIFRVGN